MLDEGAPARGADAGQPVPAPVLLLGADVRGPGPRRSRAAHPLHQQLRIGDAVHPEPDALGGLGVERGQRPGLRRADRPGPRPLLPGSPGGVLADPRGGLPLRRRDAPAPGRRPGDPRRRSSPGSGPRRAAGAPALRRVEAMERPAGRDRDRADRAAQRPRAAAPGRAVRRRRCRSTIRRPPRIKFTLRDGGPGLLPGARPAPGRVRGEARSAPLRHGARPRDRPAPAAEAHVQPTEENPVIVFRLRRGRALPRRAGAHRAGRALHVRDHHGPAEPLAPRAGLRADQDGGDAGSLHRPRDVQGALPARLRELEHGHPARAPPRTARRSPPRRARPARTRPPSASGTRRSTGARWAADRSASPTWESDVSIRLVRNDDYWEGAAELPRVPDPDPPGRADGGARLLRRHGRRLRRPAAPGGAAPERPPVPRELPPAASGTPTSATTSGARCFQDVRVRTALGLAIDVDEIIRYVLYRQGERTDGPVPAADRRTTIRTSSPCPTIRTGAARLLAEAGLAQERRRGSWRRTASRSRSPSSPTPGTRSGRRSW